MADIHVDDAEMRMPVVKHCHRLSLIADGSNYEGAVTEGQSNHLGEDWFLQDRKNAHRCPQLTRIGFLHSPLPSHLHDLKSLP